MAAIPITYSHRSQSPVYGSEIRQCLAADFENLLHIDGVDAALARPERNGKIFDFAAFFGVDYRQNHIGQIESFRDDPDVFS